MCWRDGMSTSVNGGRRSMRRARLDGFEHAIQFGLLNRANQQKAFAFLKALRELGIGAITDQDEGGNVSPNTFLKLAPVRAARPGRQQYRVKTKALREIHGFLR